MPGGAEWLAALPRLAAECAEQWDLTLGAPFEPASISLVVPAGNAVLKINFPDAESRHEAAALAHWAGDGAVRLLAHDPQRGALLVERCAPGTQLWAEPDEDAANRAAAGVLRRLWSKPAPAAPFRTLAGEAERWADEIPRRWEALGRPGERAVVEAAARTLPELAAGQAPPVVVHQDLHGGNVLRAGERWLAIDPKPLAGEPAFDCASLLRDRRDELAREAHPVRRIARRLDVLADALELDRERLRAWGIAHALAWGMEEGVVHRLHLDCAAWLARA